MPAHRHINVGSGSPAGRGDRTSVRRAEVVRTDPRLHKCTGVPFGRRQCDKSTLATGTGAAVGMDSGREMHRVDARQAAEDVAANENPEKTAVPVEKPPQKRAMGGPIWRATANRLWREGPPPGGMCSSPLEGPECSSQLGPVSQSWGGPGAPLSASLACSSGSKCTRST